MNTSPAPRPELKNLADNLAKRYKFGELENAHLEEGGEPGASQESVISEIGSDLEVIARIAERGGMAREAIYGTIGNILTAYPEGTDLDAEHGASMSYVSSEVQKTMLKEIEAKYGKRIAKFTEACINNPDLNTAEREDLQELSDIYAALNNGTIGNMQVETLNTLTEEEFNAIFEHAENMTAPGDDFNIEAFANALAAVKKGGISGLRKHENTIGWEQ